MCCYCLTNGLYLRVRACLKAPCDANEAEMSLSRVNLSSEGEGGQKLIQESRLYGHLSQGRDSLQNLF